MCPPPSANVGLVKMGKKYGKHGGGDGEDT